MTITATVNNGTPVNVTVNAGGPGLPVGSKARGFLMARSATANDYKYEYLETNLLTRLDFSTRADGASVLTVDDGSDTTAMQQKTAQFAATPARAAQLNGLLWQETPFVDQGGGVNGAIMYLGKVFATRPNRLLAKVSWRELPVTVPASTDYGALVCSFGEAEPSTPDSWVSKKSIHIRIGRNGWVGFDTFERIAGVLVYKTIVSSTFSSPTVPYDQIETIEVVKNGDVIRVMRDGVQALVFEDRDVDRLWGSTCFVEYYSQYRPLDWPSLHEVRWYSEHEPATLPRDLTKIESLDLMAGVDFSVQQDTADAVTPAWQYGLKPAGNKLYGRYFNASTVGRVKDGYFVSWPHSVATVPAYWFDRHPFTKPTAQVDLTFKFTNTSPGTDNGQIGWYFSTVGTSGYIHNAIGVQFDKVGVYLSKFVNGVYGAISYHAFGTAIAADTDTTITLKRSGTTLQVYLGTTLEHTFTDAAIGTQWGNEILLFAYSDSEAAYWPEVKSAWIWSAIQIAAQSIGTAIDGTATTDAVRTKVIAIESALRTLGFAKD